MVQNNFFITLYYIQDAQNAESYILIIELMILGKIIERVVFN